MFAKKRGRGGGLESKRFGDKTVCQFALLVCLKPLAYVTLKVGEKRLSAYISYLHNDN